MKEFNGKKYTKLSHSEAREMFFGGLIDELFVGVENGKIEPVSFNLPAYLSMDSDTSKSNAEFYKLIEENK